MKPTFIPVVAVVLTLLAACNGDPDAPTPSPQPQAAPTTTASSEPTEAVPDDPQAIPAALQGRWGMVPADCEAGRADAKGLVEIDATSLRFYESVARLGTIEERSTSRLRGTFNFEGEGMTWQLVMLLEREGDTLIRSEFGAEAMAEPSTYTRCPAN